MNKRGVHAAGTQDEFHGLILCAACFVVGVVVGTVSARTLDAAGAHELRQSMIWHLGQITDGSYPVPGFLAVLWDTGRDFLLVLLLGCSFLGVLGLPIVAGVRGFYLSFSIAAFLRAFGSGGLLTAFSLFGVGALVTVPCFFLLTSQAFEASGRLGRMALGDGRARTEPLFGRRYWLQTGIACFGLLVAVLLELYVTPLLVVWASSFLL
ncbi:MAG: hypothetical protein FWE28_03575 [Oscillospiraceae bacterium]|nr:hypothetical protein [Oscillospiraceae bacterium]